MKDLARYKDQDARKKYRREWMRRDRREAKREKERREYREAHP